jgi:putative transposase
VNGLCQAAGVSRAGYYRFLRRPQRKEADMDLRNRIQGIALQWPAYGYRRVQVELRKQGWEVNHKRVLRLMRADNLLCLRRRKFILTTDSKHGLRIYPNLAKDMVLTRINQLWLADITYIRLQMEFVYLAVLLDAFSRRCIGWALQRSLEAALVLEALRRALRQRRPRPGLVHHSDRGVQYASLDYTARLEQHGIRITMSRRGKWAMVAYTGEVVGSQPRCSRGLPGPPRRGRMRQVLGGARENRTGFDNLYPSLACGRAPLPGNASSPFARHSPFQTSSRLGLS